MQCQKVKKKASMKFQRNSNTYFVEGVFDLLHQAAFRDTLGRSLYAPEYMLGKYTTEQLMHYIKNNYTTGRLALVGIGVDHDQLVAQAKQISPFSGAGIPENKAKYTGGVYSA